MTGITYADNKGACIFKVKIFRRRGDKDKRFVVEFQRRSGDVVTFSTCYRTILQALGTAVERPFATPTLSLPVALSAPTTAARSTSAHVARPGPLRTIVLDKGTLHCLVDMASSNDTILQRESLRLLAGVSSHPDNQT